MWGVIMAYRDDKVLDVIAVLTIMRNEYKKRPNYRNTTELRKEAVNYIAEQELHSRRYKNQNSAVKTIHDACARRLKPDIENIVSFDHFADLWLRNNSMLLKNILLKHSDTQLERIAVKGFFNDNRES